MKPVEVVIYLEVDCPYCNYVHKFILRDIQVRRDILSRKAMMQGLPPIPPIDIRIVDIHSTRDPWYEWYSRKIGAKATPIVKIGGKIFYLWKEKPETLKKEELTRAELLKAQIIEELQDIVRRVEKEPIMQYRFLPRRELINGRVVDRTGVPAYWR